MTSREAPSSSREAAAQRSAAFHCGAFDVPVMSAAELVAMRSADEGERPVVVDVRSAAERVVARIPESLSRDEFEASGDEYDARDVVVACTVGRRSGAYAAALAKRRGGRVFNSTGICCYSHHAEAYGSGPHALVDAAGAPATRIHVYARPWDFASERFEAVKFGPLGAFMAAWRR